MWSSMAYFVARELHMRPYDVLTKWTCEELCVAYGEYANIHSVEAFETRMAYFRKEKPKPPKPSDKWAVIFVTREELAEMQEKAKERADRPNLADLMGNFFH